MILNTKVAEGTQTARALLGAIITRIVSETLGPIHRWNDIDVLDQELAIIDGTPDAVVPEEIKTLCAVIERTCADTPFAARLNAMGVPTDNDVRMQYLFQIVADHADASELVIAAQPDYPECYFVYSGQTQVGRARLFSHYRKRW